MKWFPVRWSNLSEMEHMAYAEGISKEAFNKPELAKSKPDVFKIVRLLNLANPTIELKIECDHLDRMIGQKVLAFRIAEQSKPTVLLIFREYL